jgi:hypothetical protein
MFPRRMDMLRTKAVQRLTPKRTGRMHVGVCSKGRFLYRVPRSAYPAAVKFTPFSWKYLRTAGAFQQFRPFPVEGGLVQMFVSHLRQLRPKGSQGLVASVQALA